jgi:hypothetical protein
MLEGYRETQGAVRAMRDYNISGSHVFIQKVRGVKDT